MISYKNPQVDLRLKYKKTMELSTVAGLAFLILVFQSFKRFDAPVRQLPHVDIKIIVQEIPQTEQEGARTPIPTRPAVPLDAEDTGAGADAKIETTDIDMSDETSDSDLSGSTSQVSTDPSVTLSSNADANRTLPSGSRPTNPTNTAPPAPREEEIDETSSIFVAYDEPPEPIGGFAAIQQNLVYPEIARKARIEGRVYVQVTIDELGNVLQATVTKSLGNNGCDNAAIAAIKAVKWKPAKQRDKPVKVSIGIPVQFKLK
jgi:periplasmic protein TonB